MGPCGNAKHPANTRPNSLSAAGSTAPDSSVGATPARRARWATTNGALPASVCRSVRPSPGDQPVGTLERCVETDQVGDDLRAGAQLSADKQKRESESAGGARAGIGCRLATDHAFSERREVRQGLVQHRDVFVAHAFLRPEDRRRTARPAKRIVDVGENGDRTFGEPRIEAAASTRANADRPLGVGVTSSPVLSSRRNPSAASSPAPASLVLLPPRPIMKRRTPSSNNLRINSPMPRVDRAVTDAPFPPGR
jgi:hypothetical protein